MTVGGRVTDRMTLLGTLGEFFAVAIALAAATAAGAPLLAIAGSGRATLSDLLPSVALPALGTLLVLFALGVALRWRRLTVGIPVGFWTGAVATIALEAVRETGFRVFDTMPGDLPMLMGVMATGRSVMQGPSLTSDIAGWADHFFNGAMFGIIYVLLVGGFPRRGGAWTGAGIGAAYGVLLGTGFLLSPAATMTGAGVFGSVIGPKFALTVYLAHLLFGAALGALAHRFARTLPPLWTPIGDLLRRTMRRTTDPHQQP